MKVFATVPGHHGVPTTPSLECVLDEVQCEIELIRSQGAQCQLFQVLNFEDNAKRDQFLAVLWQRYFPNLSDAERQEPTLPQTVAFYERVLAELRRFARDFSDTSGTRSGFSGSPFPEKWVQRHFL